MTISEKELIERLKKRFPVFNQGVGIGDDAAILEGEGPLIVTADMLVEGVDFTARIPVKYVAVKSLAANLSDLAAMGATPHVFLLSLGFPSSFLEHFDSFADSLSAAARRWRVELVGGDLSRAEKLIIAITALGRFGPGARALMRDGARAGERVYVSRPIGGSATGLHLLSQGWRINADGSVEPPAGVNVGYDVWELAGSAIFRHVAPEPETELGGALALIPEVSACIDISDGLSSDLQRLCDASGVGALIEWDRLPIFPGLPQAARTLGVAVDKAMLHGGEEFALLFTSSLRESDLSVRLGRPVYSVGIVRQDRDLVLSRNEREEALSPSGFDHFEVRT